MDEPSLVQDSEPHPLTDRRTVLGGAMLAGALVAGGAAGAVTGSRSSADNPVDDGRGGAGIPFLAAGGDIAGALRTGGPALQLGAGEYQINDPIVLPRGGLLRGLGQATRLRATRPISSILLLGTDAPADGVSVESLVLDCDKQAQRGLTVQATTQRGNYQDEPDSVIRLDNLWVYDSLEDGVHYTGTQTRSCTTSRVRVRRAGRHGFHVAASDSWWLACEATTISAKGDTAGFDVVGTNNFFQSCKAWYCRDYGWRVRGTRNRFTGCESQDTRRHGWSIEFDRNVFATCTADTAGMYDVGGIAGTADGFFVTAGKETSLVGCQAFDRRPEQHHPQQRYGFNVPRHMVKEGRLIAPTGWDNTAGLVGFHR